MSYEDKILDKFADMIMPPGTIIAYQGIEAPEGFIVYDHIKIYEDEFPRLYPVLAANPNFKKGADSDGRKWVELPEIEDLCIQMTTDTSQVGKTLEAQLPNMTGIFNTYTFSDVKTAGSLNANCYGVFSKSVITDPGSIDGAGSIGKRYVETNINFDASSGNALFSGTSLQSSAVQCLPCIRC